MIDKLKINRDQSFIIIMPKYKHVYLIFTTTWINILLAKNINFIINFCCMFAYTRVFLRLLNKRLQGFGDSVKPKSWICSRSYSFSLLTFSELFSFWLSLFAIHEDLTNPISYFEITFATKIKRTAFPKFAPKQRLPT